MITASMFFLSSAVFAEVEDLSNEDEGRNHGERDAYLDLFFVFLEEIHDVSLVRGFVRSFLTLLLYHTLALVTRGWRPLHQI